MARSTAPVRSAPGNGKTAAAVPKSTRRGTRRAAQGDVVTAATPQELGAEVVSQAVQAARGAKVAALGDILANGHDAQETARQLRAILEGASPDDAAALKRELLEGAEALQRKRLVKPDEELAADWRRGGYRPGSVSAPRRRTRGRSTLRAHARRCWLSGQGIS